MSKQDKGLNAAQKRKLVTAIKGCHTGTNELNTFEAGLDEQRSRMHRSRLENIVVRGKGLGFKLDYADAVTEYDKLFGIDALEVESRKRTTQHRREIQVYSFRRAQELKPLVLVSHGHEPKESCNDVSEFISSSRPFVEKHKLWGLRALRPTASKGKKADDKKASKPMVLDDAVKLASQGKEDREVVLTMLSTVPDNIFKKALKALREAGLIGGTYAKPENTAIKTEMKTKAKKKAA